MNQRGPRNTRAVAGPPPSYASALWRELRNPENSSMVIGVSFFAASVVVLRWFGDMIVPAF